MNTSKSLNNLENARYENLLSSIIDVVPDVRSWIPYEAVEHYFKGNEVSPITKDWLIEILRGKAHPYYWNI